MITFFSNQIIKIVHYKLTNDLKEVTEPWHYKKRRKKKYLKWRINRKFYRNLTILNKDMVRFKKQNYLRKEI